MDSPLRDTGVPPSAPGPLTRTDQIALRLLADAHLRATDLGIDAWHFAVEIDELLRRGVTRTELRMLVARGLVEHAEEKRGAHARPIRQFRRLATFALSRRSCFVITPAGLELRAGGPTIVLQAGAERPVWDDQLRELSWQGVLVKRFRQPAENQERILAAFQEEAWPPRVDDPLPPAGRDGPTRLRDTIRCLNRGQASPVLRFVADGTGSGVCWGPALPPSAEPPRSVRSTTDESR